MIRNNPSEGSEKAGGEQGAHEEDELELLGSISQSCQPNAANKSHKEIETIDETGEASGMGVRVVGEELLDHSAEVVESAIDAEESKEKKNEPASEGDAELLNERERDVPR